MEDRKENYTNQINEILKFGRNSLFVQIDIRKIENANNLQVKPR